MLAAEPIGRRTLMPHVLEKGHESATIGTKADSFRRVEVITGIGRRRRWTDDEKARIVTKSLDPATTSSAVARRHGLYASQLFVWRQQLQLAAGLPS
jgi:transposase-like protein